MAHAFSIPFQFDQDKHDIGFCGPKIKPLKEHFFDLNLLARVMEHNDECDIFLCFGPSSPYALECSISSNLFHGSSNSPFIDVSMVFVDGLSPMTPLLECSHTLLPVLSPWISPHLY